MSTDMVPDSYWEWLADREDEIATEAYRMTDLITEQNIYRGEN